MELNDRQIVELACKTLAEKKAVDIKIIEVVGMTDITDYFIVCSGRSMPQVKALCENLEEKWRKTEFSRAERKARKQDGGLSSTTSTWSCIFFITKRVSFISSTSCGTTATT